MDGEQGVPPLGRANPKHLLRFSMQVQEVEDLPEDAARWTGEKVCSNLCTPLDTPADDCCVGTRS